MTSDAADRGTQLVAPAADALTWRAIAQGDGWSVTEFICRAGPQDPRVEERHGSVAIAAVIGGSFQYRSDNGEALLYPGAFLLGNAGTCFECGHDHGIGDRCVAFQFAPACFEEIAASMAGSHRFRFPTAMLPATRELTPPAVGLEAMGRAADGIAMEERCLVLAETVLATVSGIGASSAAPSAKDQRRITGVLRHIERHSDEPLELADLAAVAVMSKYHFLRTFRRIVGVTPYEYLLGTRMRQAAVRLCTTLTPVATIAFDAGFGDLSTFNGRFRQVFGMPPGEYRRRHRRSPVTTAIRFSGS
jgi:AraC family transcriptional regulator